MSTRKKNDKNAGGDAGKTVRCALLFYFNWLDHIEHLPQEEQAAVVMALLHYARTRRLPQQLSAAGWVAFRFAAHIVDHDRQRYHLYDPEAQALEEGKGSSEKKRLDRKQETTKKETQETSKQSKSAADHTKTEAKDEKQGQDGAANNEAEEEHRGRAVAHREAESAAARGLTREMPKATPKLAEEGARDEQGDAQHAEQQALARDATQDEVLQSQIPQQQALASPSLPIIKNREQATENNSSFFGGRAEEEKAEARGHDASTRAQPTGMPLNEEETRTPPSLEELHAYWQSEGMESSAEEFFDYYSERSWQNSRKQPVSKWRIAARKWERYFQAHVKASRLRAASLAETQRLNLEHQRTVEEERARARREREAEQERCQRRACSHEEARALYALALKACEGNEQRAIEMMKQEEALLRLRQLLHARPSDEA